MTTSLFGLPFTPFDLSHQYELRAILESYSECISGYTFADLMCWASIYKYEWAKFCEKSLLISTQPSGEVNRHLIQPEGVFSPECERVLLDEISKLDYPIKIYGVAERFIKKYPEFVSHFDVQYKRGESNYIYSAKDLAFLKGRDFARKRNLIAQAEKSYVWSVEPLNEKNIIECLGIIEAVECEREEPASVSYQHEKEAIGFVFKNFVTLRLHGLLMRINDKPAAFSVFEGMNDKTAVVYFEKAERKYKGLYQLINRETAKAILDAGFEYVNREEDLDVEGLRQAKLSYNPVELCSVYLLTYKGKA